jgi:hypothetical protein
MTNDAELRKLAEAASRDQWGNKKAFYTGYPIFRGEYLPERTTSQFILKG